MSAASAAVRAVERFSRKELTSSVFDFSTAGRRSTEAPEAMMLPVERMRLWCGGFDMLCGVRIGGEISGCAGAKVIKLRG